MSRIFLIGFMGCGKTSWGKKLAAGLNYPFIDLDHALEERADISVAGYFASHGENDFRKLESEVLKQTVYPENVIVATGGGLPCFFDHMAWMNANGKTLYIKLSPNTLADRLENARVKRPLLHGKHGEDLVAFIAQKLAEREGFYKQATYIVDGIGMSVSGLMELVSM